MKNSNLFIHITCIIPALLILCTVNLSAQNYLSGYIYLGAFGSHYYYLSNCPTTWDEANEAAIEMGGYLATFTDLEENVWVVGRIGVWEPGEVWIGLRGENGIYEWTNSETSGFENWAAYPSEPVYADGAAFIGYSGYDESNWNTHPVYYALNYIVEFPYQPNCNNNPNKAYVCHNGNTICVSVSSLQSHLDHGCLEGPCGPCNTNAMQALPDETEESEGHSHQTAEVVLSEQEDERNLVQEIKSSDQVHIYPNPASEEIHVILPEVVREGTIRILSLTGQEMHTLTSSGQQSFSIDLSGYAQGLYLIDVRSVNGHYQKRVVKQ
jgi:hypothetical protein